MENVNGSDEEFVEMDDDCLNQHSILNPFSSVQDLQQSQQVH